MMLKALLQCIPIPFQLSPHVCVVGRHSVNCAVLLLSTACTVRELSDTPGACFPFPC